MPAPSGRVLGEHREIGNHADDLVPGFGLGVGVPSRSGRVAHPATDGVAAAEHAVDERLVDDDHTLVGIGVARVEPAAGEHPRIERVEVVGRDRAVPTLGAIPGGVRSPSVSTSMAL